MTLETGCGGRDWDGEVPDGTENVRSDCPDLSLPGNADIATASPRSRGQWTPRARSSAVEHYLDMVGVTGSIPVAPTRFIKDSPGFLHFLCELRRHPMQ